MQRAAFGMAALFFAVCAIAPAAPAAQSSSQTSATVAKIAADAMKRYHLKGMIVQVRRDGQNVYFRAMGESMTGVPVTTAMHFRNGAMAFTYMSTLLLVMVDQHKARLNDKLSKYRPDLPHANEITLKNLADMTSGYADYVYQNELLNGIVKNPFHFYTSQDLIRIGITKPMQYKPGTNFGYSHTNYVILGSVLEKITGMKLNAALNKYVFRPMGLTNTQGYDTPYIPEPVMHGFSAERRAFLKVPANIELYEESTYWNPSWTTANGAVEITDITDMSRSMEEVGSGKILSKQSSRAQIVPHLIGFGHKQASCAVCFPNSTAFNYGLGVVILGPWITQTKNFSGSGASSGYLASQRLTVSVVTTYLPEAFDKDGDYVNASEKIFAALGNALAPGTVQPVKR